MPTMPQVVGLEFGPAQTSLQSAGVLNPAAVGYFGTWPITPLWQKSASAPNTVLSQSIAQGTTVPVNAPVALGVSQPPVAVVYP